MRLPVAHQAAIRKLKRYNGTIGLLPTFKPAVALSWNPVKCVRLPRANLPVLRPIRAYACLRRDERSTFGLRSHSPSDLVRLGSEAIASSTAVVAAALKHYQDGTLDARDLIYTIDHVSNTLCLVADPCELLRHVHPCESWRNAANATVEEVSAFISRINIDEQEEATISFELSDSGTLKHLTVKSIHGRPIPANPAVYSYILRNSPEESVRRLVWEAQTQSDPAALAKLLRLHAIRNAISRIRGFTNFAECAQRECILDRPAHVERFLRNCASSMQSAVSSELHELQALKRSQGSPDASLQPWDLDYLIGQERDKLGVQLRVSSVIAYFERLLHDLFGISLIRDTSEDLWHPLVAKFVLVKSTSTPSAGFSEPPIAIHDARPPQDAHAAAGASLGDDGVEIAHLYMDLFAREEKANVCAQFTVRCSKLLESGDQSGARVGSHLFHTLGLRDQNASRYVSTANPDGSVRQVPATCIVCSFPTTDNRSDISAVLNSTHIDAMSAQTLFHELGHTVHALCSRTDLQHLSGNRGGVDFAEFSSHLFELYFLDGLRDICEIEGLDAASAERAVSSFRKYRAIETGRMTLLALLDLKFYTSTGDLQVSDTQGLYQLVDIFNESFNSKSISQLLGLPALSNFDHLVPYGGTYFCYLYSRVLAIKVWRSFAGQSRSRSTGDRLSAFFAKVTKPRHKRHCCIQGSTDASIAPLNVLAGRDLDSMKDELFLD
ncbi:mitochondrial intermediate peptidase [Babesia caballi]|uniref:Mitochondrial intermediate peptidase n=1 Tax=Babesia caballi TaxID=5871 RepID=A0AAV4LQU9_BABCB|nr:mitochondrial intermediate peptidase [Babesia caballi]